VHCVVTASRNRADELEERVMSQLCKATSAGVFFMSLCVTVAAGAEENPIYFGIKAGAMIADVGGFDKANNLGLSLGYDVYRDVSGAFSLEGEYTRTFSKGDVNIGGAHGDWKIETLAGYGAYRTAGDLYLKAKIGYLRENATVSGVDNTSISGRDSGFSYGAGFGFRFNKKAGVEFEYTIIESDINFASVGYFTHF
jgi:outer membrane immunogenic protein